MSKKFFSFLQNNWPGLTILSLTILFGAFSAVLFSNQAIVMAVEEPTPSPTPMGSIRAFKYFDANDNQSYDNDDRPVPGWEICVEEYDCGYTGEDGWVLFEGIPVGEYSVWEEERDGWYNTTDNEVYIDYLEEGETEEVSFGNRPYLATIEAYKFNDKNGNGEWDKGEDPLSGWEICLGVDSFNHEYAEDTWLFLYGDTEEVCKTTNENGYASWLVSQYVAYYYLWEETQEGWFQTFPYYGNGYYVEVEGDVYYYDGYDEEEFEAAYFGNTQPAIYAFKFWDKDGNGEQDEYWTGEWYFDGEEWDKIYQEEPPIPGWQICLVNEDDIDWEELINIYETQYGHHPREDFDSEIAFIYFMAANGHLEADCRLTDEQGWSSWTGLASGNYLVLEERRENWLPTNPEDGYAEAWINEENYSETIYFGNSLPSIYVFKFWDKNQNGERDLVWYEEDDEEWAELEPALPGWEICLYSEEDELVSCQTTDETGWVSWSGLEPGGYAVSEQNELERRQVWYPTNSEDGVLWIGLDWGEFTQMIELGNDTGIITAKKYFGEEDWSVYGWEICLSRWDSDKDDWLLLGCKDTDISGIAQWTELAEGEYRITEEERDGWEIWEDPEQYVELNWGDEDTVYFYNWIYDQTPPESSFDDPMDHEVIDTEIVSLNLSGSSVDPLMPVDDELGASGVRSAELRWWQLEEPEEFENYPAESFFDVFYELSCSPGEIEPEIVALNLTSVDPNTALWNYSWTPPSPGIYCFETSATDNAGNTENTAIAGPLAYIPRVEISEESSSPTDTSIIVRWETDHPATSRVIYDTVSHETLTEWPNYGYAFSTPEIDIDSKVTSHLVTVDGLAPDTTYYYRTVSVGSPVSVGDEQTTTTTGPAPNTGSGSGGGGGGGTPFTPPPTPPAPPTPTGGGTGGQVLGAATTTFQFLNNLSFGMSLAPDVAELQKRLQAEGLFDGPITGYFGPLTLSAVKAYQQKYGISPISGYVGPITRGHLNGGVVAGVSVMDEAARQALIQQLLAQLLQLFAELQRLLAERMNQ
ncbi:MAG: peptidoglycan-binding protein [Patescibacteria group bacterium]